MKILDQSRPKISLLDYSYSEIESFICEKLSQHDLDAAYLFGSIVTEQTSSWSDIDLLIVKETELPFLERSREFSDVYDLGIPCDVLVYTTEEFNRLKNSESGFWKSFQKDNRKII